MPAKTVRFAKTDTFYSPLPSTPGLTISPSSSPASSAGLITPPNLYHTMPLPHIPVQVHPILAYQGHGCGPPLNYDLTLPPSAATHLRLLLSHHVLAQPATNPPHPTLILIPSSHLPWPVRITATHPLIGVTVGDVLNGLYHQLRYTVSETEFMSLPGPAAQARVTQSFQNRYKRLPNRKAYELEKMKGLKRVDFLMGKVMWLGLSPSKAGPDAWVLHVT